MNIYATVQVGVGLAPCRAGAVDGADEPEHRAPDAASRLQLALIGKHVRAEPRGV